MWYSSALQAVPNSPFSAELCVNTSLAGKASLRRSLPWCRRASRAVPGHVPYVLGTAVFPRKPCAAGCRRAGCALAARLAAPGSSISWCRAQKPGTSPQIAALLSCHPGPVMLYGLVSIYMKAMPHRCDFFVTHALVKGLHHRKTLISPGHYWRESETGLMSEEISRWPPAGLGWGSEFPDCVTVCTLPTSSGSAAAGSVLLASCCQTAASCTQPPGWEVYSMVLTMLRPHRCSSECHKAMRGICRTQGHLGRVSCAWPTATGRVPVGSMMSPRGQREWATCWENGVMTTALWKHTKGPFAICCSYCLLEQLLQMVWLVKPFLLLYC